MGVLNEGKAICQLPEEECSNSILLLKVNQQMCDMDAVTDWLSCDTSGTCLEAIL